MAFGDWYVRPDPRDLQLQAAQEAMARQQLQALNALGPQAKTFADYINQMGGTLYSQTISTAPAREIPKAFMAGPILAWRLWRVTPKGLLTSIYKEKVWPAGEPLVSAVPGIVDAASGLNASMRLGSIRTSDVGIYAMKRREDLNGQGYTVDGQKHLAMVVGRVALWGKVIEHQKGYRAQYAYPYELHLEPPMPGFPVSPGRRALAAAIRQQYGCEVRE